MAARLSRLEPTEAASDGSRLYRFAVMGGPAELRLLGAPPVRCDEAAAAAQAEVRRIEAAFSRYRPDSTVSRVNAAAGSGVNVACDAETLGLLAFADTLYQASGGLFDATAGVLRRAWDFRSGRLPSAEAVAAAVACIGWHDLWRGDGQVALRRPGMELDFGGIAKEYAADRAAGLLLQQDIRGGYVNLAGDIRVLGPRGDGSAWRFGIQHPRHAQALVGGIELRSGALATSGDYERCIVHEGRHYGHILNPRTGWPVQGWQSVSVVSPACTAAGALCTLAMLLSGGPEGDQAARDLLQAQAQAWLVVDGQGRVWEAGTVPT